MRDNINTLENDYPMLYSEFKKIVKNLWIKWEDDSQEMSKKAVKQKI